MVCRLRSSSIKTHSCNKNNACACGSVNSAGLWHDFTAYLAALRGVFGLVGGSIGAVGAV